MAAPAEADVLRAVNRAGQRTIPFAFPCHSGVTEPIALFMNEFVGIDKDWYRCNHLELQNLRASLRSCPLVVFKSF